jgi:hypothetical protein
LIGQCDDLAADVCKKIAQRKKLLTKFAHNEKCIVSKNLLTENHELPFIPRLLAGSGFCRGGFF